MTTNTLAAGFAAAPFALLAGAVAAAAQPSVCQTWNPTKASPPVTHCISWTHEAAARMRAADCNPATMGTAAMRAQCAAMMGASGTNAAGRASG